MTFCYTTGRNYNNGRKSVCDCKGFRNNILKHYLIRWPIFFLNFWFAYTGADPVSELPHRERWSDNVSLTLAEESGSMKRPPPSRPFLFKNLHSGHPGKIPGNAVIIILLVIILSTIIKGKQSGLIENIK